MGFDMSPFLYTGVILDSFQSLGRVPELSDLTNIALRNMYTGSAASFGIFVGSKSGPQAL